MTRTRRSPSTRLCPVVANVELYDGSRELVEVDVVATAKGMVCAQQDVDGREWFAWVPAEQVRRR
ncbi:hypothetical protein ACFUMH_08465 [Cellulomonas sp. NPDC057328]|uniref:hypothetical protein n=1 Tax=Cellulomonas sp. NPDC057328 TaxID=3346101 RepID=UPI003631D0E3